MKALHGTAYAVTLMALAATGCATRYGEFSSEPSGALVRVKSRRDTTPCQIPLPAGRCTAVITHPAMGVRTVEIPAGPCALKRLSAGTLSSASAVIEMSSVPFFFVGGACLGISLMFASSDDSHYPYYPEQRSLADMTEWDLFKIGAGGVGAGALLYLGSRAIDRITPEIEPVTVHVDFTAPAGQPPSAGER